MPLHPTDKPVGYLELSTGRYPVSQSQIRAEYPNTSFPTPFIAPDEYAVVFPAPQPEHDPIIQMVRELPPVLTAKGHYEQQWEVVPRFVEYTDEEGVTHTVAEQDAASIATDNATKLAALTAAVIEAVQARLDTFAKTRNYDNILSACTYATDIDATFSAEGQYCVAARGETWRKLYEILDEVNAGIRPEPTCYADIEPELPALNWPDWI